MATNVQGSSLTRLAQNTGVSIENVREIIDKWVSKVRSREDIENRQEAASLILEFLSNGQQNDLNLSSLNLTSLPAVFTCEAFVQRLKILDLSSNLLENVPPQLLGLENLEQLILSENYYIYTLDGIENLTSLKKLEIEQNVAEYQAALGQDDFEELEFPAAFGNLTQLEELCISGYDMGDIPSVIYACQNLRTIAFTNTNLPEIPLDLCNRLPNLTNLNLSCNFIDEVPDEVSNLAQLKELDLNGNHISSIPDSIFTLPNNCSINLEETALTREQIEDVTARVEAEDYVGPTFQLPELQEAEDIMKELRDSLNEIYASLDIKEPLQLDSLVEEPRGLSHLSTWIGRLIKEVAPIDKQKDSSFYRGVIATLELASRDADYRGIFKAVLGDANITCGDRIILSILQLGLQRQLRTLDLDNIPSVLEFLQRGVWAIDLLEESANSKIAELRNEITTRLTARGASQHEIEEEIKRRIDPIEIYLGFPIALMERLKLPLDANTMLYFKTSGISQEDLVFTETYVAQQMETEEAFIDFLIKNTTWKDLLERHCSVEIAAAKEKMSEAEDFVEGGKEYSQRMIELTKQLMQGSQEERAAKRRRAESVNEN